jgi:hypothetical protein
MAISAEQGEALSAQPRPFEAFRRHVGRADARSDVAGEMPVEGLRA